MLLEPFQIRAASSTHFKDQLHALLRGNPHGVQFQYIRTAFQVHQLMNLSGDMAPLDVVDLLAALHELAEEGYLKYTGDFGHPLSIWSATETGLLTEFDMFILEHMDD